MDKIISKVAKELDLKEDIVEKAVRAQFDFIADTMREGKESVHLHFLGKFCIKPGTLERLRLLNERREEYNRRRTI